MSSEITAEMIEDIFGNHSDSVRFANFCNAVVVAVGSTSAPTIPILSEKPGADGGMDAEWTIPADVSSDFKSPFGLPGWNVFQYKVRSIAGDEELASTQDDSMRILFNALGLNLRLSLIPHPGPLLPAGRDEKRENYFVGRFTQGGSRHARDCPGLLSSAPMEL
jgi:hypothetical protein